MYDFWYDYIKPKYQSYSKICYMDRNSLSNDEIEDLMKIVKSLEESVFLLKGVSEATQNGAKEQKGGFLIIFY